MLDATLRQKSLLGTEKLTKETIQKIIRRALDLKSTPAAQLPKYIGKTICLLFFEPSTRTRLSFELAAKRLGANTLVLTTQSSSTQKGESLLDTARTIEAMSPDVLVLRHPSAGTPFHLAKKIQVPVLNAGDGFHEHPTQALLDAMTIFEQKQSFDGLKVLIVGDIAHSRVARSNIYALNALGAKVSVCGPPTLIPPRIEQLGVKVYWDLKKAIEDQEVVILLRVQTERLESFQIPSLSEYSRLFGLSKQLVGRAKPGLLVMHPGPMNRGIEVQPEIADGPSSLILNQVSNGVYLRMAVLEHLFRGENFYHE